MNWLSVVAISNCRLMEMKRSMIVSISFCARLVEVIGALRLLFLGAGGWRKRQSEFDFWAYELPGKKTTMKARVDIALIM
jgi:hypothetical protein